jgi:hypothetical protein
VLSELADGVHPFRDEVQRAWREKFQLLADYYNARLNGQIDWKTLALCLAFAHVPGIQIVTGPSRKRGRPRQYDGFALYRAVLGVIDERQTSVANACRILSGRKGDWRGANPVTLETRFHANKRQLARLAPAQAGSPSAPVNASDRPSAKYPQPPPPSLYPPSIAGALNKLYE